MSSGTPHQRTYTPPIPALEIGLQAPDSEQTVGPIVAVLDTGADYRWSPTPHRSFIPPTPAAGLVVYPAGIVSRCKQPAPPQAEVGVGCRPACCPCTLSGEPVLSGNRQDWLRFYIGQGDTFC